MTSVKLSEAEERSGELLVEDVFLEAEPWNEIRSSRLVQAVAPLVEEARREIEKLAIEPIPIPKLSRSGHCLPLDDYDMAVAWLRREEGAELKRRKQLPDGTDRNGLRRALATAVQARSVPYGTNDGDATHRVTAQPGGALDALARAASDVARLTSFHEASVVALILADLTPLLPPVQARWRAIPLSSVDGVVKWRNEVTVTFRSPEINDKQLRALRRRIRRVWGAERRKLLTKLDQKLLRAISERGGPPRHGKRRQYWQEIANEIGLKSAAAARLRYARLQKRLRDEEKKRPPSILDDI